jgi:hypothetical protein
MRAFTFFDGGRGVDDADQKLSSGGMIRFVSRTLNDGVLGNWDVVYAYREVPGKDYGEIVRYKDMMNKEGRYELWTGDSYTDYKESDYIEVLASPVKPLSDAVPVFAAAGNWRPTTGPVGTSREKSTVAIPPTVRVRVAVLDARGGALMSIPLDLYYRVYQGE